MAEIVGRDDEVAVVHAFVGGADVSPAALVLAGDAGIGKTTLWEAGIDHARAAGRRVLVARPAEAERGLAYAGLGDLLADALDDVLPALAAPRRRALEGALLLDDAIVDPRALGLAIHGSLQALAEWTPVLVAIDDVQWLDAPTAAALVFALRRLGETRVRLVLARRSDPSELESALAVRFVPVGPLTVGALSRFLRTRLGRPFPRQTMLRIHERSGGNPFFAMEIARLLDADVDPTQPLPIPRTLEELVRARLAALPAATREALALAAALGTPSESLLARAGIDRAVLVSATRAGVIAQEGGVIRFTHPLLSSVLYADLGERRRDVHGLIAEIVDDPLARARHLALAADTPDAEIAAVLDDAARTAADRGAVALAAELAEHALRLTAPEQLARRQRRALAAARAHRAAGEWMRARSIASALLAETAPGADRAEVLALLADFEVDERSVPLLEEALAQPGAMPQLQARVQIDLAWVSRFKNGFAAALADARVGLELADALEDDALRISALQALTVLAAAVGDPELEAFAHRAREIAVAAADDALLARTVGLPGHALWERGDLDGARALLEPVAEEWRDRDEVVSANLLWILAWVDLESGRFDRASECAERAIEIMTQYGVEAHGNLLPALWAATYRGDFERAFDLGERGLKLCAEQMSVPGPLYLGALGISASWSGDAVRALELLAEADDVAAAIDWHEPNRRRWTPDYVEVLLELGRTDDAVRVLDTWESDARSRGRPRVLAQAARCRGLVAAAEGRVDDALGLLERAVAELERVGDPFGRARATLALGIVRRRRRQKRPARETIADALAAFEELGAASWAARARAELGSIGGRTHEAGLTPAEQRVAALVVEGRTNREVAAALFLGERTVASHLTHIYAKLGVRSRAELVRKVQTF